MKVEKIVKFYDLKPSPCFSVLENKNDLVSSTYFIFNTAFPQIDYYEFEYDHKNIFFDIHTYNESKMFAKCSIKDDINATKFFQSRNTATKETKPFTTVDDPTSHLESYTFYYIDFKHNKMAAICNKKLSKIHLILSEFIYQKSGNCSQIEILPERIKDLESAANSLDPKWLEFEFSEAYSKQNMPSLPVSLDNDFQVGKYQLKIQLINTNKKSFSRKLAHLKSIREEEGISNFKLLGKNELGIEETINFVEALYTKTVPLLITDNTISNIKFIETELEKQLNIFLSNPT